MHSMARARQLSPNVPIGPTILVSALLLFLAQQLLQDMCRRRHDVPARFFALSLRSKLVFRYGLFALRRLRRLLSQQILNAVPDHP